MRLLQLQDDGECRLVAYAATNLPRYAILSHTWGQDHEEVTFKDMKNGTGKSKRGFAKIEFCASQVRKDGLQHFWVDTCCIDKSSSAELSEALNSMFRWYHNAAKCYVYLSDVSANGPIQSRWFTRGWTLQELLAPSSVEFFSCEGELLGDKKSLESEIHEQTGIPIEALRGRSLSEFSVPERISWAAKRDTTIEEDQAYCLLGIFDIHMPALYGEGMEHAFRRLRREIFGSSYPSSLTDASSAEKTDIVVASLAATDQTWFLSQTLSCTKHACEWVWTNQKYTAWYTNSKSCLLWIKAKAGYGKTTVAAHISQAVDVEDPSKTENEEQKPIVLRFFFRRSNQEAQKTAPAALRTIASQLAQQQPRVFPILLKRYEILSAKGAFEWSWDNISSVLEEMLAQAPSNTPIFVILDAIDECEEKSRMLILDWVKGLVEEAYSSVSWRSRPIIRVLATSRPSGDISDRLYDFPTLEITGTETANDMRALIHNRVERFARRRHLQPDVARSIIEFLEAKAEGMFLWVVLILEELERRDERLSDEAIPSKLSKIPLTLIDTYASILHNVPSTRKEDLWRIIRWLLFGSRSPTLAQLETALCLETGVSHWIGFPEDVEFLCGSFIRMGGPYDEISFIHQTARGFLETYIQNCKPADVAELNMDHNPANERLATICVQYLLREEVFAELYRVLWITSDTNYANSIGDFLRRHNFLRYAIESWAFHIREAKTPSFEIITITKKLLSSPSHSHGIMTLEFFINKHGTRLVPCARTPLHVAAYFNLPWLVDSYISQDGIPIDLEADMGDTPLVWASEMGSTECVSRLLQAGADPNKVEYDGWSSLHWAARNGHLETAKLLLNYGARWDVRDSRDNTPLDWAMDRGNWNVVGLLEQWIEQNENVRLTDSMRQDSQAKSRNSRIFQSTWQLWDYRP